MSQPQTVELPVLGMDCTSCVNTLQQVLGALPGVERAEVLLAAEKAIVRYDPTLVGVAQIQRSIEDAGYQVPLQQTPHALSPIDDARALARSVLTLVGILIGVILFVVLIGEQLGLFEALTTHVPWPLGLLVVLVAGYPVFRDVIRATLRGQVIAHTLMTLGVIAALAIGEWATAAVVVFFMRVGSYAEHFTTNRARRAVKDLTAVAPQTARVLRAGTEVEVPVGAVSVDEIVVVRPGEQIPVDGEVVEGHATIDQATITGESMPVEVGPGTHVFASTIAQLGSLRVRAACVGNDTMFSRVIKLVQEAEAHRAEIQRIGDRFSAWYLPVVAVIAALIFVLRRDPLATAAVLVVACSCSFALATPIAMLASIGAAAKRGLLIKGGKYLEALAQADVLLLDKTGTLTLGRPQITDVVALNGMSEQEVLRLAATAERYSEHPLAEAVRQTAARRNLPLGEPAAFEAVPGQGIHARVDGRLITLGSQRVLPEGSAPPQAAHLEAEGKTLLYMLADQQLVGVLAAADTVRPEVAQALASLRRMGLQQIELLTGDTKATAAALAEQLGIRYQAQLLPEDKIAVVRGYQAQGRRVVMIGDGVNDAPALAQADVGIAMGAVGTDIALEAAHMALMREDWTLVPLVFSIARRTMWTIKMNITFTALYNLVGLSLAALGFLPPIFAAAAQSLPDLGILANSTRLLRLPAAQEGRPRR